MGARRLVNLVVVAGPQGQELLQRRVRRPFSRREDHFHRLRNYLARLDDGGPILAPEGPHLPLRHIYGKDVVRAILRVVETRITGAFNAGQDETVTIEDFLSRLARLAGTYAQVVRLPAALLWERGLMPNCSHFSEPWMSALDNRLGKEKLGLTYTPLEIYLGALVQDFRAHGGVSPPGYGQRAAELELIG